MYVGINDTIFERDEVETTLNMEKEEIDAWICGTTVAKSSVKECTEVRAGSSEGMFIHDQKSDFSQFTIFETLWYFMVVKTEVAN